MLGVRPIKKIKNPLIISLILIVCITIIGGTIIYLKNVTKNPIVENEEKSLLEPEDLDDTISMINVDATKGIVFKGETARASVSIKSTDEKEQEIWLGYSLQDPVGKYYNVEPKAVIISSQQVVTVDMEWIIPEDSLTGDYTMFFALWDKKPNDSSKRLASLTLTDTIRIYQSRESFESGLGNQWIANDSELGRSTLQSKNVTMQDGKLQLKLLGKNLYGAEIQTLEKVHYGSYEIRMKIPDAPSSITGFFLYDQPDYDHEIDIEIYNQSEAILLLTIYANGKQAKSDERILSFDPTADFHTYRIGYYPDRVDFFVDDVLMKTWTNGFTTEAMFLMLNTWYPNWLEGTPSETDRYLLIDWILK